jgi:uncharacterized protein YllA (UPF0747 family)
MATDNKKWTLDSPRKSATIVKCPHCSHTGSARGLFTHVRLAHPGITTKPKTSTRIVAHPYDVKGLGRHTETLNLIKKKSPPVDPWINILTGVIEKLIKQEFAKYKIPLQSAFINSSSAIGSIPKKNKRKHYGE